MSTATLDPRPALTFEQLGERLDLLHAAAQKFPGRESAYMAEVLGALLNRISTEDLKWAIEIGNQAYPATEEIKGRLFPATKGARK